MFVVLDPWLELSGGRMARVARWAHGSSGPVSPWLKWSGGPMARVIRWAHCSSQPMAGLIPWAQIRIWLSTILLFLAVVAML
jgi:hypothetical protein